MFRVWDWGLSVYGLEFGVKGLGLTVRCRDVPRPLVLPAGLGVGISEFRVWGVGFQGFGRAVDVTRPLISYTERHGVGVRGWERVRASGEEPEGEGGRGKGE